MPTTTADTPSPQGTSLEDAALAIEGLLDQETDTETPETPAADAAPTDGESVAADAKSQETAPTEEEGEGDEAEASDDADKATEIDPKNAMVTVTIDGKSEAKPLEEVIHGYQRQADYSRKMADLTTERKNFETEVKAVTEERTTYKAMLEALRNQLTELQPEEPDWAEVYRTDPVGYARRRDEWRDKQEKIAAAKFELERVQSEERKQAVEANQKLALEKRAEMLEMMPVWKDPKVWEADRQAIVKHALAHGYTAEEVAAAYDPRAIVMFNKARLWDELQAGGKPKPVATKGPKVASAGAARDSTTATRLNAAQQRLAKSGRIEDAAKVFEQLI